MSHAAVAPSIPINDLADGCRKERERFLRGEPCSTAYALELFRRAICEADDLAWHVIVVQYGDLIKAWIRQHPAASLPGEDDLVNATFTRFWAAIRPERWHEFESLGALLHYLKMCARSVVLDNARARRRGPTVSLDRVTDLHVVAATGEDTLIEKLASSELWDLVRCELSDETERLLAYLSVVCDMKPGEIQARHPTRFASVADVYRVKRNVLARLRRSPRLRRARGI